MRELHFFAGVGGGILGGMLLGHTCVCAVEINPYRRKVLLQRQRDGILPKFPIWDDVRTFDAREWKGFINVLCSGFPCQRHSDIGKIHGSDGFDGWPDTYRVAEQVDADYIYLENVEAILRGGYWWKILADLSWLGYDTRWGVFQYPDSSQHAPTIGRRVFALAKARRERLEEEEPEMAQRQKTWQPTLPPPANRAAWARWIPEPSIQRIPDGLADYMGELEAIGDGQVPDMARFAWETLSNGF